MTLVSPPVAATSDGPLSMTDSLPPVALRDLVALTKPRLASLVLFTTAGGAWLAGASLTWPVTLYALLGTTRARGRASGGQDDYESVDYGLTALLLRAAVASGVRPRFVYLSSVGAAPNTNNAYLSVRARLEREIRESGLPYTFARPSFITGPDRDDGRLGERIGSGVADAALSVLGALGARKICLLYTSPSPRD